MYIYLGILMIEYVRILLNELEYIYIYIEYIYIYIYIYVYESEGQDWQEFIYGWAYYNIWIRIQIY